MNEKKPTGLAIIGCGYVADFYMATKDKFPDLQILGVYDKDPERLKVFCKHYGLSSFAVLNHFWMIPASLITVTLYLLVLMRFGLVAIVLADCVAGLFLTFPNALEASAWYSDTGYAALAIFAVVVLYAFRTSLGGRPLITAPNLDD